MGEMADMLMEQMWDSRDFWFEYPEEELDYDERLKNLQRQILDLKFENYIRSTCKMSTELTKWDEELAKHAQKAAAAERPALAAISLRGGIMSYEKQPVPGNKLSVIIVASTMQRLYYDKPFDPNKPASPICFAFHDGTDDVPWVPHEKAHAKQSDLCATCPMNEWGSDIKGGRGKACKEVRKLALIPNTAGKEMAMMSVPVMSVKNWSNYVNGLAASVRRPPWGVVTEVSVHPDARSQFTVKFDLVELVPEEKLGEVYAKIPLAMEALTTPYDYQNPQETMGSPQDGKKKKY